MGKDLITACVCQPVPNNLVSTIIQNKNNKLTTSSASGFYSFMISVVQIQHNHIHPLICLLVFSSGQ